MFKRLVREDFLWKIISLSVAMLLWLTVVREPDLVTSTSVPIFYRSVPKGLEIASTGSDRVFLEVRGPASKLTPEALADTAVQLDLGEVSRAGIRTFTIRREDINLPLGVNFVRAIPSQVQLDFDRQVTKQIDVRVLLGGKRGPWRVAEQHVTPASIRVLGPAKRVDEIEWAETDPIDLPGNEGEPGERRTIEQRVHVFVDEAQVRFESSPMVVVKLTLERIPGPNTTGSGALTPNP